MWPFKDPKKLYRPLKDAVLDDQDDSIDLDDHDLDTSPSRRRRTFVIGGVITVLCVVLFAVAYYISDSSFLKSKPSQDEPSPTTEDSSSDSSCRSRREWRTLSQPDKDHYITSVKCLLTKPSAMHANSSLYEDFPWIHSHVGYSTHHSASFLPWHRYLLHIYETTLRDSCSFTGTLVYWDWTLDWEALDLSPVFSPTSGFGGDGDPNGAITVGNHGRCLLDGPFGNGVVNPNFYDVKYSPHCLSRGFRDDNGLLTPGAHLDGHLISPSSMSEVLQLDKYEDFVKEMESRVHDVIPFGIGGDFETFTAPYDPLFFLHHVQLDRLWWIWQHRDAAHLEAYGGFTQRHSMATAKLEDEIKMGRLAPAVEVREVMRTEAEGGLLCYRY